MSFLLLNISAFLLHCISLSVLDFFRFCYCPSFILFFCYSLAQHSSSDCLPHSPMLILLIHPLHLSLPFKSPWTFFARSLFPTRSLLSNILCLLILSIPSFFYLFFILFFSLSLHILFSFPLPISSFLLVSLSACPFYFYWSLSIFLLFAPFFALFWASSLFILPCLSHLPPPLPPSYSPEFPLHRYSSRLSRRSNKHCVLSPNPRAHHSTRLSPARGHTLHSHPRLVIDRL